MAMYTFRRGQRVNLTKDPSRFLVDGDPANLEGVGLRGRLVGPAQILVEPEDGNVDSCMEGCRAGNHVAHHVYFLNGEELFISDRVIVTFCANHAEASKAELMATYNLDEAATLSPTEVVFRVTDATGMNPAKLVVRLSEDHEGVVAAAELDVNHIMQVAAPTDPEYLSQWHLHTHSTEADERSSSHCEDAWAALESHGSKDVVVAVADDGCQLDHVDFDGQNKFAGWAYFQGNDLITSDTNGANRRKMYQSGANHGTSCAGIIAAEADGSHTVGAAPGCKLLPIKWESDGPGLFISDTKLLQALDYISGKADIMNNSWGGGPVSQWSLNVTNKLEELARSGGRRPGKGILFLWAAGNSNTVLASDHTTLQDVPYTIGWKEVAPRDWRWEGVHTTRDFRNNLVGIPGVLHIAALGSTAQRSHYSNYGPGIALTAPSSNGHTYHRNSVDGLGVVTATGGGVTKSFGGTSSATPLVAGIAALVISANAALSALEVAEILKDTCEVNLDHTGYPRTQPQTLPTVNSSTLTGSNPFDVSWDVSPVFDGAFQRQEDGRLWSHWFGYGKVNALSAVLAAKAGPSHPDVTSVRMPANVRIPDNSHAWTRLAATVAASETVDDIGVTVDITHTYIGDLQIALLGPSGAQALLHDRAGGSANNLVRTFSAASTPALRIFRGQPSNGTWELLVRDLAASDNGTVNDCVLALSTSPAGLERTHELGSIIPENDPRGISDVIKITSPDDLTTVSVSVDIAHTYVKDLRITLTKGEAVVTLFDRELVPTNTTGLTRTWKSTAAASPLSRFHGRSGQGDWTINVSDHAAEDRGKLNSWALKLTTNDNAPAGDRGAVRADTITGTAAQVSPPSDDEAAFWGVRVGDETFVCLKRPRSMMHAEGVIPLDLSGVEGEAVTVTFNMKVGLTLYGAILQR